MSKKTVELDEVHEMIKADAIRMVTEANPQYEKKSMANKARVFAILDELKKKYENLSAFFDDIKKFIDERVAE